MGWFVVRSRLVSLGPLSHYKPPSPTRGGLLDLLTRSTGRRWLVATGGWSAVFCGFAGGGLGFLVLLGVLCLGLAAVVQWGFRDAGCAPRRRHSRGWCSFAVGVASCLSYWLSQAVGARRLAASSGAGHPPQKCVLPRTPPSWGLPRAPTWRQGTGCAHGQRYVVARRSFACRVVSFLALTTARGLMRVRSYVVGCGPIHRGGARGHPRSRSRPGSYTCDSRSVSVARPCRVTCTTPALTKRGAGEQWCGRTLAWGRSCHSARACLRSDHCHACPCREAAFLTVLTSPHWSFIVNMIDRLRSALIACSHNVHLASMCQVGSYSVQ